MTLPEVDSPSRLAEIHRLSVERFASNAIRISPSLDDPVAYVATAGLVSYKSPSRPGIFGPSIPRGSTGRAGRARSWLSGDCSGRCAPSGKLAAEEIPAPAPGAGPSS